jgi:hypothetical protein
MKLLLLIAFLTLVFASSGTLAFEKVFGGPELDRGVYVSPTQDSGYIVVGYSQSFGQGDEDIYLVKTDSAGELMWTRTIGGTDEDNGWAIREIADGFILAGFTKSFGAGGYDFYLVKTDATGEVVWSETYGGPDDDRCWALALTGDGGYLLAGETASSGAGERDFFIVKTDSRGGEDWSRTYGGKRDDRCFAVALVSDGGYMLAGQTYSEGAGDRDVYIVKISASGDLQWSQTFGGPASDVGHYIVRTSDGAFVVTGYTTSFAPAGDDPYLIKIDAQGKTHWTRVLAMDGVNHTLTGEQATDGGFFLVGFSEYPARRVVGAVVVKTDPEGNLDWYRNIMSTDYGESFGYTVRATSDGGCIFTGHTTVNSAGNRDLMLVKVANRDSARVDVVAAGYPDSDPTEIKVRLHNGTTGEVISGYPCTFYLQALNAGAWSEVYRRDCSHEKWSADIIQAGEVAERSLPFSPAEYGGYSAYRVMIEITGPETGSQVLLSNEFFLD